MFVGVQSGEIEISEDEAPARCKADQEVSMDRGERERERSTGRHIGATSKTIRDFVRLKRSRETVGKTVLADLGEQRDLGTECGGRASAVRAAPTNRFTDPVNGRFAIMEEAV